MMNYYNLNIGLALKRMLCKATYPGNSAIYMEYQQIDVIYMSNTSGWKSLSFMV